MAAACAFLTDGWQDEAPTWAPNGRIIQFFRTERNSGRTSLWQVDLTGRNERRLALRSMRRTLHGDRFCREA